jgi:hypothetical protein
MEYIISVKNINSHNIIFRHPIKNQNEKFTNFYKIIYSNEELTLKYILLSFEIKSFDIISNNNNYLLYIKKNDHLFNQIKNIESMILRCLNCHVNKNIVLNCYEELMNKPFVYCFQKKPIFGHFCVKISGVWEDSKNIGLVYKLYYNTSTEKLLRINC